MIGLSGPFINTVKFGKFALLIMLFVLSLINGHKEYISQNPRKFMWDNFVVGAMASLAMVVIAYMRGAPGVAVNLAFISFLLFFVYNVFRELSGFNTAFEKEKLTQGEALQVKHLKWPMVAAVGAGAVAMMYMAFRTQFPHPKGTGWLMGEAAIFASLTAMAEVYVAWNHGEDRMACIKVLVVNFAMFFVAHIVLQMGGFYNLVFNGDPPCIQ